MISKYSLKLRACFFLAGMSLMFVSCQSFAGSDDGASQYWGIPLAKGANKSDNKISDRYGVSFIEGA